MSQKKTIKFNWKTRKQWLHSLSNQSFDIIVIGGGITGAGIVRDAALRGLKAILFERFDFGSGTSSKSSKLVHGGLRYLEQGRVGLTREACSERNLQVELNPHLVQPLGFIFPAYKKVTRPLWQLRFGMMAYDMLAGAPPHAPKAKKHLNVEETIAQIPGLKKDKLQGSVFYYDADVDDARLALENIKSAVEHGAWAINYATVEDLIVDEQNQVGGVKVNADGDTYSVNGTVVINATGTHVDQVRSYAMELDKKDVLPSRGIHLMFPKHVLPIQHTVVLRSVQDKRPVFIIPWFGSLLCGTTDNYSQDADDTSVPTSDVEYILETVEEYFPESDVRSWPIQSVFAGVRPLVTLGKSITDASQVSREHHIFYDKNGLISIAGGKLTTFRLMAQQILDRVTQKNPELRKLSLQPCRTKKVALACGDCNPKLIVDTLMRDYQLPREQAYRLMRTYGANAEKIAEQGLELVSNEGLFLSEINYVLENECAVMLKDILLRRIRLALWGSDQGLNSVSAICSKVAEEMNWTQEESQKEIAAYEEEIQKNYRIIS